MVCSHELLAKPLCQSTQQATVSDSDMNWSNINQTDYMIINCIGYNKATVSYPTTMAGTVIYQDVSVLESL